ncbi:MULTISPECIES: PAS domain S-box protein [Sphingobacterium]|jgi:two-component system, OmpR family, sensor histidine kinase VicK|uniref:PAS domain S-box protein n=1 Tax=Sphingobacterium TaxID=28453 RepID=UPI00257DE7A3|nr:MULTISPECIES: PAS domain S-box protein [Sphingobacterium]
MSPEETIERLEKENRDLKQRVSELSEFIEKASISLHWVNSDGIIIWANQAELDLLGYTYSEYIGQPIKNYHADQNTINDILSKLANNERIDDYPAILKCKNGDNRHVVINSSALMKDNEFMHSMCFTKDVTEAVTAQLRKDQLTEIVKEKEERLRLALASTGLGTWDWNSDNGMVHVSEKAQQILDLPSNTEFTDTLIDLVHPDDRNAVIEQIRTLSQDSADAQFEFTCRIVKPQNYSISYIKVQGSAYFSAARKSRRIIGAIMDITDQKKAIQKSAEMAAIVSSSYDAIIGKTLEGIITSWNDAASTLFGYTPEEMIGQPILKLIPPDRHQEEDFILGRMRLGHSIKHFETVRLTKSGKLIDLSLTISPIKNELGEIIGVSKIARDITEKKQEEKRKNVFISMASHELKTPLTSVLMSAQIMQQHKDRYGEKSAMLGTKIEGQVKKMMVMIQDFLSVAEVDEGKLQLNQSCFALEKLMKECIDDMRSEYRKHDFTVSCDPSIHIFADRPKIDQVLGNLLSNAVKYSPLGGIIDLGAEKLGENIRIYVRDQGMGIDEKHARNIFKAFYRVDNLNTSNISGFGIGLYVASEILRSHGSRIEVKSKKGSGSTFYFDLPARISTIS